MNLTSRPTCPDAARCAAPRTLTAHDLYLMEDAIQLRAARFIRLHAGAHLDRSQLIARTVAHLRERHPSDAATATLTRMTIRALSEYEARGQRCYIDVDQTTAFQVALEDPDNKTTRVLTVADLLRLAQGYGTGH